MDDNLYDEFGNYIGPELSDNEGAQDEEPEDAQGSEIEEEKEITTRKEDIRGDEIVLHEDKKYYPDAEEVYKGVETLVEDEDTQAINQPIIGTEKQKEFDLVERKTPETRFDYEFMKFIMETPELIRNVVVCGSLHHGKTSLMDMFINQTHTIDRSIQKNRNYTDTRVDEQDRRISLKATPMSLILSDSRDKSYLLNLFDAPGHPNFTDEFCCASRISDGALLVVDAVEGVMMGTENAIKYLVHEKMAITVLINKIDRLILELRLPPIDAYLKIRHTLEEINGIIINSLTDPNDIEKYRISPILGNVCFSSTEYGFCFSLRSFAVMYSGMFPQLNPETLVKIFWGDYYYNPETRKFTTVATKDHNIRTFVQFILDPIYKIFSHTISHEYDKLAPVLAKLGIYLKKDDFKKDTKELLSYVCSQFFGNTSPIIDMVVKYVPNARVGTTNKVNLYYTGKENKEFIAKVSTCSAQEPLLINIVKLYNKSSCLSFDAFGRVISGTITKKQQVKVLGENYSIDDEEDLAVKNVTGLFIHQGRYRIEVDQVKAGNWVLIEGIDQSIIKSATITAANTQEQVEIFRPVRINTTPHVKIAVEPLIPSELPKMLEGIRKVNKSYPLLVTKVEESGEHLLIGSGELYMDSVLHDLREMYSEIEIKVADPVVTFCETVVDTSSIKCYVESHNKKNKLTMLAEPLDKGLAEEIEAEVIDLNWPQNKISQYFEKKFEWDLLASRSVWAFGPEKFGANLLANDTLPSETDPKLLSTVKDSIIQGFRWGTKEGPLCDEPIRNVKFKLLEASISPDPIYRGGGYIIPAARRVCYSSFLMATPRVMEPMIVVEVLGTSDSLGAIYTVLARRRGHIISETPKPGTPLYIVKANIPAIDSFGFETDLRTHTTSQAFVLSTFDYWSVLAGDPLDKTIVFKPLEPSLPAYLAREFVVKTRRRKGLSEDVSIVKYFDDPILLESLKNDTDYKNLI